jgi:hypothetical protein
MDARVRAEASNAMLRCLVCGNSREATTLTYSEEDDGSVFLIFGVPAFGCSTCEDASIDPDRIGELRALIRRRRIEAASALVLTSLDWMHP